MDKIKSFAERLVELMDYYNITKSDVATSCHINKSNMTRYCSGAYQAKQDVLYTIAEKYNVSEAWLMGYNVPMFKKESSDKLKEKPTGEEAGERLSEAEKDLLACFRMLPESGQKAILVQLQALAAAQRSDGKRP